MVPGWGTTSNGEKCQVGFGVHWSKILHFLCIFIKWNWKKTVQTVTILILQMQSSLYLLNQSLLYLLAFSFVQIFGIPDPKFLQWIAWCIMPHGSLWKSHFIVLPLDGAIEIFLAAYLSISPCRTCATASKDVKKEKTRVDKSPLPISVKCSIFY